MWDSQDLIGLAIDDPSLASIIYAPRTFEKGTEEAKALFASPTAKGVYWMLRQHSPDIGSRTLQSITVFCTGVWPAGASAYTAPQEIQPWLIVNLGPA